MGRSALALGLFICGAGACKTPGTTDAQLPATSAAPAVASVAMPAKPQAEARGAGSFAYFDGPVIVVCTDWDAPLAKLQELNERAAVDGGDEPRETKLNQTCDSLGRPALTTCTMAADSATARMHYYDRRHSDKYIADCVKNGGKWETNRSPEAQAERAQQELEALQKRMTH